MPFRISPPVMLFAGVADAGHGPALRAVPRAAQHAAGSVVGLKGQAASRRARAAPRASGSCSRPRRSRSRCALLAAAGFFVKSLLNVSRVDLGVKIDNVITFGLSPELNGYTPERTRVVLRAARGRARGHARRHRRHGLAGAAARGQQLGQRPSRCRASRPGPTPTTTRASTRSAPAISERSACR